MPPVADVTMADAETIVNQAQIFCFKCSLCTCALNAFALEALSYTSTFQNHQRQSPCLALSVWQLELCFALLPAVLLTGRLAEFFMRWDMVRLVQPGVLTWRARRCTQLPGYPARSPEVLRRSRCTTSDCQEESCKVQTSLALRNVSCCNDEIVQLVEKRMRSERSQIFVMIVLADTAIIAFAFAVCYVRPPVDARKPPRAPRMIEEVIFMGILLWFCYGFLWSIIWGVDMLSCLGPNATPMGSQQDNGWGPHWPWAHWSSSSTGAAGRCGRRSREYLLDILSSKTS